MTKKFVEHPLASPGSANYFMEREKPVCKGATASPGLYNQNKNYQSICLAESKD